MPYSFEKYEKDYNKWKEERSPRFPGVKDGTRRFLANVLDLNRKDPVGKRHGHRRYNDNEKCYKSLRSRDK